jgi:hypothetical protein
MGINDGRREGKAQSTAEKGVRREGKAQAEGSDRRRSVRGTGKNEIYIN